MQIGVNFDFNNHKRYKMRRLGQFICLSFLVLTFSCDTDELFDNENPDAQLLGEWEVVSVESVSYSSTMVNTVSGQSDTSVGEFTGDEIDMRIAFAADNTFTTSGDYLQVLTIESPFPDPLVIESRFNDFEGGGTWEFDSNNDLLIQNIAETLPQTASVRTINDTELVFEYAYTRTLFEGTITRVIDVEVNYVLAKN